MKEPYRKGDRDSILASSLADEIARSRLKRRQRYRAVERYWHKMLGSRSWHSEIRWEQFQQLKGRFPLLRPKLYLPYAEIQAIATL